MNHRGGANCLSNGGLAAQHIVNGRHKVRSNSRVDELGRVAAGGGAETEMAEPCNRYSVASVAWELGVVPPNVSLGGNENGGLPL